MPDLDDVSPLPHELQPTISDRRRSRWSPRAKLLDSCRANYLSLAPQAWYPVFAADPNPHHVWLYTPRGLTRVQRADVELRGS